MTCFGSPKLSSFCAPFQTIEFAADECVDRIFITAGLKPKQVSIVSVGWPCEGRRRFANPKAPTDDQAAAERLELCDYR